MQKSASSLALGPGGLDIAQSFFKPIHGASQPSTTSQNTKISVIGVGNVGMAIAQTILTQDLADEIALVDVIADKLRGEMLDLQHAAAFLPRTTISASVDYSSTVGSDLVIFSKVIPPLSAASPEAILLIVSNLVDVLTYLAWKLSRLPANRVIGSGTNLDSSSFWFLIADDLDVNAQDVQKSASSLALGPGGLDIAQSFFKPIHGASQPSTTSHNTKISIIGVGNVGMAIAQTILTQDLADKIALVDVIADMLRGEMLDLQHAAAFFPRTTISASVDYSSTVGSDLVIVTAGDRQIPGESRLNLVQRNLALFSKVIPPLSAASPEAILLIVSNPVDVLTYLAWKLFGLLANRVIGFGTNLDSLSFRFLIADHLDVNAQDV
nr:lactate dehydrogenase/glycoside hydrolase, family 4, C-terminal [Tanacetum cinerariifolium]